MSDSWFYSLIVCCLVAAASLAWSLREPLEVGRHPVQDTTASRR